MMPWRTFLARLVVGSIALTLAVFAGLRLASAVPGGPTRDALTYSGVLRERAGMANTRLTFVFNRGGGAARCTTTTDPFTPDSNGAFSVPVLLSGSGCPNAQAFFDGDDVQFDVRLGDASGEIIASNVPVTPVPYARFADQAGVNNDCPVGYVRDTSDMTITAAQRRCVRRRVDRAIYDEVVRVGVGATAFWIDRYEACVNTRPDDTGVRQFSADGEFPSTFPRNGQATVPLYALSQLATTPARWITWFQANEACRASGKRLPTGDEWLAAARGTRDDASRCSLAGGTARPGEHPGCVSDWGAQDMIGNLAEWTAEWNGAPSNPNDGGVFTSWPRTLDFGSDQAFNVGGSVQETSGRPNAGLPAAALRGGASTGSPGANGIFVIDLGYAPSFSNLEVGFRCVIPR